VANNISYPNEAAFRLFIDLISREDSKHKIKKYLPHINDEWYKIITDCMYYIQYTSQYEREQSCPELAAKILYKIAKRHELGDGNKRSAVIGVYLFALINDYLIGDPQKLKIQAKRAALTKGRKNEDMIKKRITASLGEIMIYIP